MRLSTITAAAVTAAILTACGPKAVPPPPNNEPGLRENKANMMDSMDDAIRENED